MNEPPLRACLAEFFPQARQFLRVFGQRGKAVPHHAGSEQMRSGDPFPQTPQLKRGVFRRNVRGLQLPEIRRGEKILRRKAGRSHGL